MQWQKRPILYEIPTWAWLADLSVRYARHVTLGDVPETEWDALAALHIDAVWFMGVWQRSPMGIAVSNANPELQTEFRRALNDYSTADNVGSAYCVRAYVADKHLGGTEGLGRAREQLKQRRIQLLLDYVPNHVAPDHPWVERHPEYFVRGTRDDLEREPNEFIAANDTVLANGRDPYFAPWRDVVQLNAFDSGFRAAAIETVKTIASQCDGMRCDMAMLLLNDIFARTWSARAGEKPQKEFWQELIPAVKQVFPDVLFIGEVYWDLEYELMQNGFDYCYDKRLYDRLEHGDATGVRGILSAGTEYQEHLLRFIENHDEPRAAATFAPLQERAAAVIATTLPGAKLFHDGQLEGRQVRMPVFFGRRMPESKDFDLDLFYRALLQTLDSDLFHAGEWAVCEPTGWSDNSSFQNIVAWSWCYENRRVLIVVNYSAQRAQAMIHMTWQDLENRVWRLGDTLNGEIFLRDGNQLREAGLYVDLDTWRFHFLTFE